MKKEYKDLEMETVRFDAEDVITASGGCEKDCPLDKVPCFQDGGTCLPLIGPCDCVAPAYVCKVV